MELAAPNFRQERQATARRGLAARCRRLTALLPNSICDFNATLLIGRDNVNDWRPTCVAGAKNLSVNSKLSIRAAANAASEQMDGSQTN